MSLEVEYGRCTSNVDPITLLEWNDNEPTIFINFKRYPNKPGLFNCYNSDSLKTWLKNKDNSFAAWIQKPGQIMDSMGHGGKPDLAGERYVRIYTPSQNVYLIVTDDVKNIANGIDDYIIFETEYLGKVRIGDPSGHFYEGGLHGQAPGEDIYRLIAPGTRVRGYDDMATQKARNIMTQLRAGQDEPSFGAAVNLALANPSDLKVVNKLYTDFTTYNAGRQSDEEIDPQLIFSYENDDWTLRMETYNSENEPLQTFYLVTPSNVQGLLRNFVRSGTRIYDASDVPVEGDANAVPKANPLVIDVSDDEGEVGGDYEEEEEQEDAVTADLHEEMIDYVSVGDLEALRGAIDNGADVKGNGNEALFAALQFTAPRPDRAVPDPVPLLNLLIVEGADVNYYDSDDNRTPLSFAVFLKNFKGATVLLERGAEIDAEDNLALNEVIIRRNLPAVLFLLREGAKVPTRLLEVATDSTLAYPDDICNKIVLQSLIDDENIIESLTGEYKARALEISNMTFTQQQIKACMK